MIRAVCFDMDGVLFDTERIGCEVTRAIAQDCGCRLTEEQRRLMWGLPLRRARELLETWFPGFDSQIVKDRWYEGVLARVRQEGLILKPGAQQILHKLRQEGVKLALTSSNARIMVDTYLALAGWENAFDLVLTGNDISRGKPDPEIYLMAARRLGVSPGECIGVEDSPTGVRSVRAAGMISVMIPDLLPFTGDLAPFTDRVLSSLDELDSLL